MKPPASPDLLELDLLQEESGPELTHRWQRVVELVEVLSERYKIRFSVLDDPVGCQDGIRLGQIGIYCLLPENSRHWKGISPFTISFSRISGLFTLRSYLKEPYSLFSERDVEGMRELLEDEGFTFISPELLDGKYTGGLGEEYEFETWDHRFFKIAL